MQKRYPKLELFVYTEILEKGRKVVNIAKKSDESYQEFTRLETLAVYLSDLVPYQLSPQEAGAIMQRAAYYLLSAR